jgi:ribosome-associated toxin RatA of RatAB toxin-antitoxin module
MGGIIPLAKELTDLPPMPEFTDAEWKTLNKGKHVKRQEKYELEGRTAGKGVAYMIVDRPPERVWDVILDFGSYPKFYPNVSKCENYRVEDNEIFTEFILKVGLIIKVHYHIHHTFFPTASRMTWKVDQSRKNDFKESIGEWTVWPMEEGKSLIGYSVILEIMGFVPKLVEDMAAQTGLNKVMEALKKRVHKQ